MSDSCHSALRASRGMFHDRDTPRTPPRRLVGASPWIDAWSPLHVTPATATTRALSSHHESVSNALAGYGRPARSPRRRDTRDDWSSRAATTEATLVRGLQRAEAKHNAGDAAWVLRLVSDASEVGLLRHATNDDALRRELTELRTRLRMAETTLGRTRTPMRTVARNAFLPNTSPAKYYQNERQSPTERQYLNENAKLRRERDETNARLRSASALESTAKASSPNGSHHGVHRGEFRIVLSWLLMSRLSPFRPVMLVRCYRDGSRSFARRAANKTPKGSAFQKCAFKRWKFAVGPGPPLEKPTPRRVVQQIRDHAEVLEVILQTG